MTSCSALGYRLLTIALSLIGATTASAGDLTVTRLTPLLQMSASVIVGRARCGASTWLLTERLELVEVRTTATTAVMRKVLGLMGDDRPWGLACVIDGTLWTLATPRALVRIAADGRVAERIMLSLQRFALFGAGDRVLFQQLPIAASAVALAASPPRQPAAIRSWPGLIERRAATRERELAQNMVNCGIGFAATVPCWFIDDLTVTVSDGRAVRTIDVGLPGVLGSAEPSIRDVALASHSVWLLADGRDPDRGNRAGITLLFQHEQTRVRARLDLKPTARVLLAASDTSCVLLTTDGALMEVTVKR